MYRCNICEYIYDESAEGTAFDSLADDYACPVCAAGKEAFELEAVS
jgi:rubredoxin